MRHTTAFLLGLALLCCSVSGPRATEDDLVEAYVMATRARERGEDESQIQRHVDQWLEQEGLTREDLAELAERLDARPGSWARVWSRIDERLRTAPEE
jgi:hypothetical protein